MIIFRDHNRYLTHISTLSKLGHNIFQTNAFHCIIHPKHDVMIMCIFKGTLYVSFLLRPYSSDSQHEKPNRSCKVCIWDLNSIWTCQFSSSILDMGINNISVQSVCLISLLWCVCWCKNCTWRYIMTTVCCVCNIKYLISMGCTIFLTKSKFCIDQPQFKTFQYFSLCW